MSQVVLLRQLIQRNCRRVNPSSCILLQQISFSRSRVLEQQHKPKETTLQEAHSGRNDVSTDVRPLGEKIKENTATVSYTAIIIAGVGITGIMFWAIFRELFSSFSPNNVYSAALDLVKEDPRVQDSLGAPIKGYGEESRRHRRQHVAHSTYERNGVPHMRMHFYVQGLRNKATVHLEARKMSGKMEYRYLFVQLDHFPRTTIIIEDNRAFDPVPNSTQIPLDASNLDLTSFTKK